MRCRGWRRLWEASNDRLFLISASNFNLFIFRCSKIAAHDTHGIRSTDLLELLAGRSLVAGQVMDGADRHVSPVSEMRTDVSGGLEDHALRIMRIEGAV